MPVEFWQDPRFKPALYSFVLVIVGIILGEQAEPLQRAGLVSGATAEQVSEFSWRLTGPGTLTYAPDAPVPVPPGPEPDPAPPIPEPAPAPPVVTAGPRHVMLVRETAFATAQEALELAKMRRQGEFSDYIKGRGHVLYILDQDSEDQFSARAKWVEFLLEHSEHEPPFVAVLTADKALLDIKPWNGTADQVLELLKANGG